MRIVGEGEGCPRFEETCEAIAAQGPDAPLRAHASTCAECAATLRAAEALRRGRAAFDAPEPGPAYWAQFSDRLDARIRAASESPPTGREAASRRRRLVLGIAASAALVAGALIVRQIVATRVAPPPPAEAELLQRLDAVPAERVAEYLDEIAPPEIGDAPEDLADADSLVQEEGAAPSDEDNPYDLFQDLGDDDRALLLKEMRGEIG